MPPLAGRRAGGLADVHARKEVGGSGAWPGVCLRQCQRYTLALQFDWGLVYLRMVPEMSAKVELYDSAYSNYESDVYRQVRFETYGEDLGQTSWVTTEESNQIPELLELT